jgi:hypothetical protein
MKRPSVKSAIGSIVTAFLLLVPGGTSGATGATLPPCTRVTAGLESGHYLDIYVTTDGVPQTISCSTLSADGTVKKTSGPTLVISNPVVNGCFSSIGPAAHVTTNSGHGRWKLADSSGPTMNLSIPQAGFQLETNLQPNCIATATPHARAQMAGAYDSQNLDTITKYHLAVSSTGCKNTDLSISAAIVLSPSPGPLPPW